MVLIARKGLARLTAGAVVATAMVVAFGSAAQADSWTNITSNLANMPSECGNLTMLSVVPGSGSLLAGVALKGLWQSNDAGASWQPLGTGRGSASITNRPSWISYDPLNPAAFWESGIYNGGGAYRTTDGGATFVQLGAVTHTDFVSVDYADPDRKTLLVGGHEQSRAVWKSTDGGKNWTNIGQNLPDGTGFSTSPVLLDAQTYVVNADKSWGQADPGVFRTTDGGATWTKVAALSPSGAPLVTSRGAIYWAEGDALARSTDRGASWLRVGSGLLGGVHPIEVPGGRIVSAKAGTLVVSSDGGTSWEPIGPPLPYVPAGVVYSDVQKALFIWHWDCGTRVLPDAIEKVTYDFGPATAVVPTVLPTPAPTSADAATQPGVEATPAPEDAAAPGVDMPAEPAPDEAPPESDTE